MREYKKPLLILEEFVADQSVADGCTKTSNTITTTNFAQQTVRCIVSTSDNVFGSANCNRTGFHVIDETTLVWYDEDNDNVRDTGEIYYVWRSSRNEGAPSRATVAKLNALAKLAGERSADPVNGQHLHAGPVSSSQMSSTVYSFSY